MVSGKATANVSVYQPEQVILEAITPRGWGILTIFPAQQVL